MKKRLLALLLIVSISTLGFSACGGSDDGTTTTKANGSTSADGNDQTDGDEEVYTVVMGYIGDAQEDEQKVEEAINAIIEPELNARLDLRQFSWGGYQQELQLVLSGSEAFDITPIIITNAGGYVNNGQVIDLTDLIEQHGDNIKEYV
jgi:putative aldouronate transport system substrate-binding protein